MSVNIPQTLNFLPPSVGKFEIHRSPNLNYFIQKITFPSVTLPKMEAPTPFRPINLPSDHIFYDNITLTFKLDEDLAGYFEIYDWIVSLGRPESGEQALVAYNTMNGIQSDCTLILMTNELVPNIQITFQDCLPVTLSGFELDTTTTDIPFLTATLTMSFRQYTYARLSN